MSVYHRARAHVAWLSSCPSSAGSSLDDMPLFPTSGGRVPTKDAMVRTFEALATRCEQPLLTPAGQRCFGGHTLRVMGVQVLTSFGVEIGKVMILARHSGESIYRYAAEAPLAAIQSDISKHVSSSVHASNTARGSCVARPNATVVAPLTEVRRQLERMESRLSAAELRQPPCAPATHDEAGLVINATTKIVHRLRHGSSSITLCGWDFGTDRLLSGKVQHIDNLKEVPWPALCSRCLCSEREAAMNRPGAFSDSGSCSD